MKYLQYLIALIDGKQRLFMYTKDTGITLEFTDGQWDLTAMFYCFIEKDYEYYYLSHEEAMKLTNNVTPFEILEKCLYFVED